MKHSIRKQMAGIFIGFIFSMVALSWILNAFFLEPYYIFKKKRVLVESFRYVNQISDPEDYKDTEFLQAVRERSINNNMKMVLLSSNFSCLISDGIFNSQGHMIRGPWQSNTGSSEFSVDLIEQDSEYKIQKIRDYLTKSDFLEIWANLNTGYHFAMWIPIEKIRESVGISREFIGYVSAAGLALSVLIVLWLSKKITDPIRELTLFSQDMEELDFHAHYESRGVNEIDLLGEHFNKMAQTLKNTISKLKTVNNELQRDLAKREEVDAMRKEFLSNVSHELKTPIALIQGYSEGLKECINDDSTSRDFYCDVIVDESRKMNDLIKKLMTLNQLEFGSSPAAIEQFDLTELIQGIVQSVSNCALQNGVTLLFRHRDPVLVWSDAFRVEEVVTNYISNAIEHASGNKLVDIEIFQQNGKVRVSVTNTGLPIPKEALDKIWIKFYKVDKARTREHGGSGIGLSIVKAIMESLNQEYGVMNTENGVTFWFELDAENYN